MIRARARAVARHPLLWGTVAIGIVLAGVMTFAYVGAFVSPLGRLHDLPMAVVDLDVPQQVGSERIDVGHQLATTLLRNDDPQLHVVRFRPAPDEAAALELLDTNKVAGVVIAPADLSTRVVAIGTSQGVSPQAAVRLLINDAAGSLPPAVVERVGNEVVAAASSNVRAREAALLSTLGVKVDPRNAVSLASPIVTSVEHRPELSTKGGRGLPPFYVAVMVTLTGFIGMSAIHITTGALTGEQRVDVLGRRVPLPDHGGSPLARYLVEAVAAVVLAIGAGLVIPWVAIGLLGAQHGPVLPTVAFCVLGVAAVAWFTLLAVSLLGPIGTLLMLLLTTIFGVPSAGGVYPAQALPSFFRALGEVLPLRWFTDGLRALFYFGGRADAGLAKAVVVVATYAIVSLVLGALGAAWLERRHRGLGGV